MAVKMRLMRMGKTKSPHYRVVVIDGRAPRDGRYIDLIGRYDPRQDPSLIEIDAEKAVEWLRKGAQPTEAVSKILDASGALTQFKVKAGKIHTIGAPQGRGARLPAEEAPAEEELPQPPRNRTGGDRSRCGRP
jgi:small subunit ribosomal protein S16